MRVCLASGVILLLFVGCRAPDADETYRFTRFSMGTVVDYTVVASNGGVARAAVTAAHNEMERVSQLLWEDDTLSAVYGINEAVDSLAIPREALDFLTRAQRIARETAGAFDPTIKPVSDLYDFKAAEPLPPTASAIKERLKSVGYENFRVGVDGYLVKDTASLAVAVGGIAKGYAVDRAVAVLTESGVEAGIVNAGGDLYCFGSREGNRWRIGVRDPDIAEDVVIVLNLQDIAAATSGDYQQYFEHNGIRYHHILDPARGTPARGLRTATVVANTAERADALATALFVLGAKAGLAMIDDMPDAEALVVDSAGVMQHSAGMLEYIDDPLPVL
jgi:thiamine biosynthesis lipoprotein